MSVATLAYFFFSSRRRHTRLQGDWSSDVCSSDLTDAGDFLDKPRAFASSRGPMLRGGVGRAAGGERGEISVVGGSLKKKINRMINDERMSGQNKAYYRHTTFNYIQHSHGAAVPQY